MGTKMKFAPITLDDVDTIERDMADKGYLTGEYVVDSRTTETDVPCPCCGNNLTLFAAGNSYQITCETESLVIETCRGL